MSVRYQNLGAPDEENQEGNGVLDSDIFSLLDGFEHEFVEFPVRTPLPFVLLPSGLIASGKTTIVRAISEHYSLVVVRTDDIRAFLGGRGYNLCRTAELAYLLVERYLEAGYGVAIDADVIREKDRSVIYGATEEASVPLVTMRVDTPESVILARLDDGNQGRDYKGRAAVARYFERKRLHGDSGVDSMLVFRGDLELGPQLVEAFAIVDRLLAES